MPPTKESSSLPELIGGWSLGGVDKLAMLGEQASLGLIDRAAIPIDFTL